MHLVFVAVHYILVMHIYVGFRKRVFKVFKQKEIFRIVMGLKYHIYGFSFFENKEKAIIFRMEQFMLFNKFFILFFSWVDFVVS